VTPPLDDKTARAIVAWVRGEIAREEAAGYARLRRIPSTYTWRIIDYVSSLPQPRRHALFDAFAANALLVVDPTRHVGLHGSAVNDDFAAFQKGVQRLAGPEYYDARMLRAILGDLRSKRPSPEFQSLPPEVIQRAETIVPTSAAEIRKAFKSIMGERFGATPEKASGGVWHYVGGTSGGRPFRLWIDYGGQSDQLRYELSVDDERNRFTARRLNLEKLLGFGHGNWDFLTAGNLHESLALLVDLITDVVELPERLTAVS